MATLLWFQRDLRLENNQALNWALKQNKAIIAAFVHSPEEDSPWQCGAASSWWLYKSLQCLSQNLSKHNVPLYFFLGNSSEIIPQLVSSGQVETVCWNNRHEPKRTLIEDQIETQLSGKGIIVKRFCDNLLQDASKFLTRSNATPYKVFTPFYKRLRQELLQLDKQSTLGATHWPDAVSMAHKKNLGVNLEQLGLLDTTAWYEKLSRFWTPGENSALGKLDELITQKLVNYGDHRDYPGIEGTSLLSPHLHFGEISTTRIMQALSPFIHSFNVAESDNAEAFFRQLIWREFARYILKHFPETVSEPMNKNFSSSFWQDNQFLLQQWQQGQTGVAIIDAGMRQLWDSGWMHNRVRMLSASFLTKNLGIPWQQGAQWFWHTLIDADLANNTMGWQWVAGCGVDAAPYFRIFNPYTQTKRFDKKQIYIRRWNSAYNKNPAQVSIVDVDASRKEALQRYKHKVQNKNKTVLN